MTRGKKVLAATFAVYLLLLAYVLLTLGPVGPTEVANALDRLLRLLGVALDGKLLEFVLNIILFLPLGALGLWLFAGTRPGDWTAIAFVGATFVEVMQRYALPTRTGEARDVVANTFGTLTGAVVACAVLALVRTAAERRRLDASAASAFEPLRPPLDGRQ